MKRFVSIALGLVLCLWSARASAQTPIVIDPTKTQTLEFLSPSHNAVIPATEVGAGGQVTTGYQATLFIAAVDVGLNGAIPVQAGPTISKTLATAVAGVADTYELLWSRFGVTVPPCTVVAPATCPTYTWVIVPVGPGGAQPWEVLAESDPFTFAAALRPTSKPAAVRNVKIRER